MVAKLLARTAAYQQFDPPSLGYLRTRYRELDRGGHVQVFIAELDGVAVAAELFTGCGGVLTSRLTGMHRDDQVKYPVLVLTGLLTGAWFGLRAAGRSGASSGVFGSSVLSALAVGCPICNKIVVALLGVSGALGIWAPVGQAQHWRGVGT